MPKINKKKPLIAGDKVYIDATDTEYPDKGEALIKYSDEYVTVYEWIECDGGVTFSVPTYDLSFYDFKKREEEQRRAKFASSYANFRPQADEKEILIALAVYDGISMGRIEMP